MQLIPWLNRKNASPTVSRKSADLQAVFSKTNHKTKLGNQDAQLKSYQDWVFGAAKAIAEEAATIDFRLYVNRTSTKSGVISSKIVQDKGFLKRMKAKQVKVLTKDAGTFDASALEEIDNHPLLDLLHNPNPFMTKDEFFELLYLHMELAGEAFWCVFRDKSLKVPTSLYPLMPYMVDVVPDPVTFIKGYIYNVNGKRIALEPNDVIHFKYMNPNNLYRGQSVVQAAAKAVDSDTKAAEYNLNVYENDATPAGLIKVASGLGPETAERLRQEWDNLYKGTANAKKVAVIEEGLEFTQIGLSQKDMEYLEARRFNRDQILALFGVPPSIIGITENANRAVAEAAEYSFVRRKIKPKMLRIANRITEDLAVQFDKKLVVSFTDPVPEDKEFVLREREVATNKWMTVNEVRLSQGLDKLPNGDVIYQPMGLLPMGEAMELPELPGDSEPVQESLKTILTEVKALSVKKKFVYETPEERIALGEALVKSIDKVAAQGRTRFLKSSRRNFNAIQDEVLKNLRKLPKGKTVTKASLPQLFDAEKAAKSFLAAYLPIYKDTVKEAANEALILVGVSGFDMEDPAVAKYFKNRPGKVVDSVIEETDRKLRATLTEGINAGETFEELSARVANEMGAAADFRSDRIARTETINASSFGMEEAWQQSEVVEAKEWYTARDEMVCEFCGPQDGKTIGLGDTYHEKGKPISGSNGGTLKNDYGNIDYPPLHPNCRCTLLPVLK